MTSLLEGSLAARLQSALTTAQIPFSLTVQHGVSNDDPFNPEIVWTDYEASGWVDDYSLQDRTGTLIEVNDRQIYILVNTLSITPATTDRVVTGGKTYTIVSVRRDPASTCWVIQARA